MKKAKIKDKKEILKDTDTGISTRNGIIVLLSIMVVFIGFYLLTDYLVSKNKKTSDNPNSNTEQTENITFNKLLSQEKNEYYVFAILTNDKNKSIYNVYATDLKEVYYIDMSDSFNKSHIGETTKIEEKAKDIVISDSTLFYIKDGKIVEYKTGSTEIIEYLKTKIKKPETN